MKKRLLYLLVLLPCLAAPCSMAEGAGQLDRGFGHAGKVTNLVSPKGEFGTEFVALDWGGGGKIVAVVAGRLIEYRSDGRRDRSFGKNGAIPVLAPAGAQPQLQGLAVDSRGRILVAGTVSRSVFVARYLQDGRADESFGEDGSVVSDLGLPPPTTPPPSEGSFPPPSGSTPDLEATGLIVDSDDRPLVTGAWQSSYQNCYLNLRPGKYVGFVARFDTNGALDPSFDLDGLRLDPEREADEDPVLDGSDVLFTGADPTCRRASSTRPVLTSVAEDGSPDEGFGVDGTVDLPFFEGPTVTLDRFGRKLVVGAVEEEGVSGLIRLTRDGSVDDRFAGGEGVSLFFDRTAAAAVDENGGVLVVGSRKRGRERWDLILGRRMPDGRRDRRFARGGWATTRFDGVILPAQILTGGAGKVLVGGVFRRGERSGIALVRYLDR